MITKKKKEEKVVTTASEKPQLSEDSQTFLHCMKKAFGVLVADYIKERMLGLSEDGQFMMAWKILHYLHCDEVQTTGDLDMDIKISEVIELLPHINVEIFRMVSNKHFPQMPKASDEPVYAN